MMTTSADEPEARGAGYYLVLLRPGARHGCVAQLLDDHVAFVEAMVATDVVLLGGDFGAPVDGAETAYLLRTASRSEAEGWAARDPFVQGAAYEPTVLRWDLVGINLGGVDPALTD
jgi:uncharacterized protein YciI